MLKKILAEKLGLIQHPKDIYFKEALKAIFARGPTGTWKEECRRLFTRVLSRIAIEVNVSPFDEDQNEILFKHHLPDSVTGMIRAIEEILFISDRSATHHMDVTEEFETALHLILRLLEWTVWNYEKGRCIYGQKNVRFAESVARLARHRVEVWGDRDEVWLTLIGILAEEFHLGNQIESSETYYSCSTYSMIIKNIPDCTVRMEKYWSQSTPPRMPALIVAIQARIVDQSLVEIELRDLKDHFLRSTGVLEGEMLARVADLCGTPFGDSMVH